MSMINLDKPDKFLLGLIGIIIFLIGLSIFTGKSIVDSMVEAYKYDTTSYQIDVKVDQSRLDTAYKKVFEK